MLDIFHSDGTCPNISVLLKRSVRGLTNELPIVLMSLGDISSGPPGFKFSVHEVGLLHLVQ